MHYKNSKMIIVKYLFWLSIFFVFYSYFGYAIFIKLYLLFKNIIYRKIEYINTYFQPYVTVVVAAYNEEDIILDKIKNCLGLNYPGKKLKFVFVADGSSDGTVNIIKLYPQIELYFLPERKGKVAAINRVMDKIETEFVIFCDANTLLNNDAVKEIVKHYSNKKIGGVAGEKKVIPVIGFDNSGTESEGLYWKYESKLKQIDSDFYSVVGAAGELFSIRTHLFEPVETNVLLDDFIISMNICKKGYRIIYEPKAYAIEAASITMKDEKNRKIRISAGGFQSVAMLRSLLNIFKYGKLSFLYISHRVLRWVLCPFLLPEILICNLYLVQFLQSFFYQALLITQLVFYGMALMGWIFIKKNKKISLFYSIYYFVFMNMIMYLGFIRYLNNKQSVLWVKAKRK